jgi:hypothetical protein
MYNLINLINFIFKIVRNHESVIPIVFCCAVVVAVVSLFIGECCSILCDEHCGWNGGRVFLRGWRASLFGHYQWSLRSMAGLSGHPIHSGEMGSSDKISGSIIGDHIHTGWNRVPLHH